MPWRDVETSPLMVVGVAVGALGLWTCGYGDPATGQAILGPTVPSAAESSAGVEQLADDVPDDHGRGVDDTAVEQAKSAEPVEPGFVARAPSTGRIEGPRLRAEPDPEALGLPIAIDDESGQALHTFHEALAGAARGEGQARIAFYGASHVASDLFTGLIRRELQQRYGDAGHGFVLPAHPWRHYRHLDVEIESSRRLWETHRVYATSTDEDLDRYGVAGVAVESDRAGAWGEVRTAARGDIGGQAGLFDLFYLRQPGGGDFDVFIDGRRVERVRTAAESFEPGYATYRVEDGPHSFRVKVRGNGKVRIFGVAVERERPGVIVDTLGINGARARYQLLWEDTLHREHLRRRDPDLVVLAYGTNESGDDRPLEAYERDLRRVIERVQEAVPQASCLLVGPSDRPVPLEDDPEGATFEDRPRTGQVNEIQFRVAQELGCGYFDLVAFQGGPLSMVEWAAADPPFGAPDHVHYTVRGYHRLGEVLLGALLERYDGPDAAEPAGDGTAVAARAGGGG